MKQRVLIVEDEWLIAEELADSVRDLGLEVAGIAPNCAAALEVLSRELPKLAIVDTELAGETCEVVLEECDRLGVPVIISSGHAKNLLPDFCAARPYREKPLDYIRLRETLLSHDGGDGPPPVPEHRR